MSIIGQQVFAAPGQVFSTISGGGGGGGPVGNTLTLSTLTFGVGLGQTNNNIQYQTNQLVLAGVGDSNQFNIGFTGSNSDIGNQYTVQMIFGNGAEGDITFGDINGSSSALTAINYQAAGYASGNISTFIYGSTEIKPDGTGGGSRLYVSSLNCSSINGAVPGGNVSIPANLVVSTITGQTAIANSDANSVLRQASDGSGRSQLAYNTTDRIGFGTYPILCPTAPSGVQMGNLACALDSNANPAGFAIGGDPNTNAQGALVFNDSTGANNDDWIVGGGGTTTHFAKDKINFSTSVVNVPTTLSSQNLLVSSINGGPPAGTLPTAFTSGAMSNYFQGNSSGAGTMFDLQDPFPSPFTYSVQNWITINGAAKAIIDFSGSGNTNNLRDSNAGSGPAHLDMSLYWDNNDNNFQQFIISSWDSTAALSGSFGPTTSLPAAGAISTASTAFPGTFMYTTDPISGSAAFTATLFGKRTVKLKTNANIFLNSGDPTENYTLTIRAPYVDSANTAVFSVNQG